METRSDGVTLVSVYHFASGALSLLVMCVVLAVLFPVSFGIVAGGEPGAEVAAPVVALVGLLVGSIFLLIALANVVVGWGLWQRREWARVGALALAVVRLLNVPVGTVIGGLIIWYLLQDSVKAQFRP